MIKKLILLSLPIAGLLTGCGPNGSDATGPGGASGASDAGARGASSARSQGGSSQGSGQGSGITTAAQGDRTLRGDNSAPNGTNPNGTNTGTTVSKP